MRNLLVPTDFSNVADNALNYAAEMANAYNLDIALLHVTQLSALTEVDALYADSFDKMNQDAEIKMNELIANLQSKYRNVKFIHKVETGLFMDSLDNYCKEINPVAVVMGITGSGSVLDKIIGSNAFTAMTNINYPLIVVPRKTVFKTIQTVCFACDLQKVATSTPLLSFKAFTKLFDAELHILNIDFHNRNYRPNTQSEINQLDSLFENIKHSFHFIENENVEDAIDDYVEKENMDMLIMIPRKYSFFESLFHKSKTKEMLFHSHVPILALHG